jgi:hypothetical protein
MLMSVVYAYTAVLDRVLVMALQRYKTADTAVGSWQGVCGHVYITRGSGILLADGMQHKVSA